MAAARLYVEHDDEAEQYQNAIMALLKRIIGARWDFP
jgi:hypothetical protein